MNSHSQQAAARFDEWANSYSEDRISSWFTFYQSMAMSKLKLPERDSFLDVGCGTGWAVREAAKQLKSGKACGIDISPKMIENALAQTRNGQNQTIEFQVANSEEIPYQDQSFSSIICTFSIHHYQNPVRALSEMKRVLKDDGSIVILDSARDVSFPIWLQDRGRRYFEKSHVKYYTTKEMKALVAEAELQLVGEITTVNKFMDHNKVFTGLMLLECSK
ncbi:MULTISPECIES: methyltransferase domain-containing protein [Moorena]|uniref:Methyltransferase domain-containing protein n=1 Tax=Moorena producens (strain JHB) TaxID=1454205 RepID=A0A1D9FXP3_MOOP1|nr:MULTISPECIES: methyltransferase domain-containing protein [Moorena]AOY80054.1 methyltransferase domain-containing protein [Moorena producens JHB]NEP34884.1 class I SAM-dependent methyltransferase [Moorena sp. SIO3B2]NEQ10534.1 class I SAM-dependent methyltransferase [Moorena sp. SIO4E2]NET64587.1 class I SAM-dependent methyltransferase [Moorena sp. SIO1G6]